MNKSIPMTPNETRKGDRLVGHGRVYQVLAAGRGLVIVEVQDPTSGEFVTKRLDGLLFRLEDK